MTTSLTSYGIRVDDDWAAWLGDLDITPQW